MSIISNRSLQGILWITLSAVCFGSYGIWSKLMAGSFGEFSQGWIRGLLILSILLPIGIRNHSYSRIHRKDVWWFVLVSLGAMNQAPYFYAFSNLTIGTATLLFYASLTVGGYIIGKLVFYEKMTWQKITAFLLALSGMYILFEFSLGTSQYVAGLAGVVAGLMGGIEVTCTKKVSDRYSNIQILTVLFVVMFLGNIPIALFRHESIPTLALNIPWLAQFGYTIAMLGAMYCVVKGFQYLEASIGSLIGLSEILFAALFGISLFGESITISLIVGGSIILFAGAIPLIYRSKKDFKMNDT